MRRVGKQRRNAQKGVNGGMNSMKKCVGQCCSGQREKSLKLSNGYSEEIRLPMTDRPTRHRE